jgi:hypothetical protein
LPPDDLSHFSDSPSSSSSDDTSDEAYHRRHQPYEINEINASIRVYPDSSLDQSRKGDQDISGFEDFEDLGNVAILRTPTFLNNSPQFHLHSSNCQRRAGDHLRLAHLNASIPLNEDTPNVTMDIHSKILLHIETSPLGDGNKFM